MLFRTGDDGEWDHPAFTIDATELAKNLCGPLTYTIDYSEDIDNSEADTANTGTVTGYTANQRKISFQSNDEALIGKHTYTVTSKFTNYPSYGVA